MKLSAHNLDVEITHAVETSAHGLPILKISAICGKSNHTHTVTVGAMDGPRPAPPTQTELQKMLDDGRQYAASEAAWKESVRAAISKIS